jgi:segregation and condensation protein B
LETDKNEINQAAPDTQAAVAEVPPDIKKNLKHIIEAVLFAADEPLSVARIKEILNISLETRELRKAISEINHKLQADKRPFEIVEVAGGFQFRTVLAYQKYIKALFKDKAVRRLSHQALETLAIVAYKQPVSKSEIEGIRNVNTDVAMKTLLERRLIKILGKSEEKPGKPIVYGTTKDFLKYFGLNRISDLPKLEEFEEIAKAQEQSDLIHDALRDPEKERTLQPAEPPAGEQPSEQGPPEEAGAGDADSAQTENQDEKSSSDPPGPSPSD